MNSQVCAPIIPTYQGHRGLLWYFGIFCIVNYLAEQFFEQGQIQRCILKISIWFLQRSGFPAQTRLQWIQTHSMSEIKISPVPPSSVVAGVNYCSLSSTQNFWGLERDAQWHLRVGVWSSLILISVKGLCDYYPPLLKSMDKKAI